MSFIDVTVSRTGQDVVPRGASGAASSVWRTVPAVVFLEFLLTYLVFGGTAALLGNGFGAADLLFGALAAVAAVCLLGRFNCYELAAIRNPGMVAGRILAVWCVAFTLAGFAAAARDGLRIWPDLAGGLLGGVVVLAAGRVLAAASFRMAVRRGLLACDIVIIGSGGLADRLVAFSEQSPFGIRVRGVFGDGGTAEAVSAPLRLAGQTMERLIAFRATHPVDTIVVAVPAANEAAMAEIAGQLSPHFLNVRWLPGEAALAGGRSGFGQAGDIPGVRLVALAAPPFCGWRAACKRATDWLLALAAIILLGPVLLVCVIGVKLSDPGPVLFRQLRIGYRNQAFEIYKFRSMYLDSCGHEKLTERDDPRVFAFGRIMRKLSLDELPQLFNVLRGDMSLVGPRPHMPEARAGGILYPRAVANYALRHRVKPGITGWAQVNGWRGPTDTVMHLQRRVDHDLDYIDRWSLLMDYKILVKTALLGFFGRNAF